MVFNSIEFAIFLPVVFLLYWFVFSRNTKAQNAFLLIASYTFYAFWDWKLTGLLLVISLCAYSIGMAIEHYQGHRIAKKFGVLNILLCISVLFIFKYYDFFAGEFSRVIMHGTKDKLLLNLVLPVGLSFYVLRCISYTIEISKRQIPAEKDIVTCLTYIAFFPQLLSGPIARPNQFIPQLKNKRTFTYEKGAESLRQILWGLFKKVVIADNCAIYVDSVFNNIPAQSGSTLLMTAILYTLQIYADFSGYSDMAIGVGKLFGFNSLPNFNYPYFSRNVAEFWRKWHISLTSWFRDYIYIPLGGNRVPTFRVVINTGVVFLVSGLWHGANWTFITWGFYHALLFVPLIITGTSRKYKDDNIDFSFRNILKVILTFFLVAIGWLIFRSESIGQFFTIISTICSKSLFSIPWLYERLWYIPTFSIIFVFIILEWLNKKYNTVFSPSLIKSPVLRVIIYWVFLIIIFIYFGEKQSFIYFNF